MITRIELDGFKSFQKFKLDLGPFQVIVGPNGAGKSNLFDAFRLLSVLASPDGFSRARYRSGLEFSGVRGETEQLFTLNSEGKPVNQMRLAVEMLVEPQVTDRMGETTQLSYTRLRYELEVKRGARDRGEIRISHESLRSIEPENDSWLKRYNLSAGNGWLPLSSEASPAPKAFISTEQESKGKTTKIRLHQDGDGGELSHSIDKIGSTVLSSVNNTEFPHALAAQKELAECHFLQLNPEELRLTPFMRRRLIGPNYPNSDRLDLLGTLRQMQHKDKFMLADVSRDLAELVPGTVKVELKRDETSDASVIWVTTQDGRSFSWQALSDGTLRLLALAVLANDPDFDGLFCMEEPENGVHPLRLNNIARLLKRMATDFSLPKEPDEPLRQVLVSTHSPVLISQPEVVECLLFAYQVTSVEPGKAPMRITRISPVNSRKRLETKDESEAKTLYYTLDQVEKYLSTSDFDTAIETLEAGQIG